MTLQQLLLGLEKIIGKEGVFKFYIDDGNICAPHDKMIKALEYLTTEGPKYGFNIKPNKGSYMVGKCASTEEAEQRKQLVMTDFHLNASMIHIHPHNGGLPEEYGASVLGSFIGTEDFIGKALEKKSRELDTEVEAIMGVESLQLQYLLLRWCFAQKIIYWQRTIPPDLMNKFIEPTYTAQKRTLLSNILGLPSIPQKHWLMSTLHIQNGGLGLFDSSQTSHAAFVASLIESLGPLEHCLQGVLSLEIPMIDQFHSSVTFLNQLSPEDTIDSSSLLSHLAENDKDSTLQHFISSKYRPHNQRSVESHFDTPVEVAWLLSLQDPDAGMWLEVSPKTSMHRMTNSQFRTALTLRLFLPQQSILAGTRCLCRKAPNAVSVDAQGVHYCSGCLLTGGRIQTHNRIRDHIVKMMSHSGVSTITEEQGCFRAQDPDNGCRGDISAFNIPNRPGKYILDVRLASPVPPNAPITLTMSQAKQDFRAGNKAFASKQQKYGAMTAAANLGFLPLVFEITGRIHPATKEVLRSILAKSSENRSAPPIAMWRFWISALQIQLQKALADSIIKLSFQINGKQHVENHENSLTAIRELAYVNTRYGDILISQ
jgi:hypothetical protein